jgi:hypothetical protein
MALKLRTSWNYPLVILDSVAIVGAATCRPNCEGWPHRHFPIAPAIRGPRYRVLVRSW